MIQSTSHSIRYGRNSDGCMLTVCRRLPYIHDSIAQRLAGYSIGDTTKHIRHLTVRRHRQANGFAVLAYRRIMSPEGTKDSGGCRRTRRRRRLFVCDLIHQPGLKSVLFQYTTTRRSKALRFETNNISNQLSFIPAVSAHLSCPVEE